MYTFVPVFVQTGFWGISLYLIVIQAFCIFDKKLLVNLAYMPLYLYNISFIITFFVNYHKEIMRVHALSHLTSTSFPVHLIWTCRNLIISTNDCLVQEWTSLIIYICLWQHSSASDGRASLLSPGTVCTTFTNSRPVYFLLTKYHTNRILVSSYL